MALLLRRAFLAHGQERLKRHGVAAAARRAVSGAIQPAGAGHELDFITRG